MPLVGDQTAALSDLGVGLRMNLGTHTTAESIEPTEGLLPKETKGLKAIQQKAKLFISLVENFHGSTITDPVIAGDYFTVGWTTDIQMKGQERQTNNEICLHKVKDGKIVLEEFFY